MFFNLRCKTGWSRLAAVQPVSGRFWNRTVPRWSLFMPYLHAVSIFASLWYCHGKGEGSLGGGNRSCKSKSCVKSKQGLYLLNPLLSTIIWISCWQSIGFTSCLQSSGLLVDNNNLDFLLTIIWISCWQSSGFLVDNHLNFRFKSLSCFQPTSASVQENWRQH